MLKRKNIIKIAIDSPAAAGAGTQAKLISKHYNFSVRRKISPKTPLAVTVAPAPAP